MATKSFQQYKDAKRNPYLHSKGDQKVQDMHGRKVIKADQPSEDDKNFKADYIAVFKRGENNMGSEADDREDYQGVAEETELLDEDHTQQNFERYYKTAVKWSDEIGDLLEQYIAYVRENNERSGYYDIYSIKEYCRTLEDLYDRLCSTVESAERSAKMSKSQYNTIGNAAVNRY